MSKKYDMKIYMKGGFIASTTKISSEGNDGNVEPGSSVIDNRTERFTIPSSLAEARQL